MYVLESATERDILDVMRLAHRNLTERYDQAFFQLMLENAGDTFVVARDLTTGNIGAFGLAVRDGNVSARLLMLAVESPLRNRGLGGRVLRDIEMRLRRRQALELSLEVREDNMGAISFYRRHGYDIHGALPRYYADGARAVVMSKGL